MWNDSFMHLRINATPMLNKIFTVNVESKIIWESKQKSLMT